ncbi:MAG TPA: oligosaccharide flippase family protein [Solirubrobacteraceae bacterium]|nr:oligosaccharide flippase family protein [Solirubrobacteraceae bacterium]
MVVLTSLASATNYASNLVFSRVLNPVGFGELTSLLALAVILALPTGAAQTVIAERVAHYRALGRKDIVEYLLRHALAHVAVIAAAVSVLYVAAIPLVVDVLDLQHPGPAIALAPLVTLMFLQPVALGGVQGLDRFVAYGIMVLAIAVSRIAFGLPWAWAGGGAGGAIGGQAIGQLVVLVGALWVMRRHFRRRGSGAARAGLRRRLDARALTASAAFIAFAVISNLDVVLARLFLSPHDAGIYAAVATVGKVVTFLPAAIAIAMVPSAARARHSEGDSSRILRLSALVVTGTALAAAIPAALAPGLVVDVMFGSDYRTAEAGVLPIVAAGAGFAMVNLLVVYAVAIRDQKWAWLLVLGVAAQVVGITLFHDTPAQVACVQAVVAAMILAVNEYWFHSIVRRRPQAA